MKRSEIKIAKQFANFILPSPIDYLDKKWKEFINIINQTESWEIVSFQIGDFKNDNAISIDREHNKYKKWDVIYKHAENGFRLSKGAGFVTFQNYDYNKMLSRPDVYKIWQVKINNQLYSLGNYYPKSSGFAKCINAFFYKDRNLYIQTTNHDKILIK